MSSRKTVAKLCGVDNFKTSWRLQALPQSSPSLGHDLQIRDPNSLFVPYELPRSPLDAHRNGDISAVCGVRYFERMSKLFSRSNFSSSPMFLAVIPILVFLNASVPKMYHHMTKEN
jgi:hypothetical protein